MKVLKFGGTSVGTVESLQNVKKIVEAIPGNAIVVVSALGGLTDKLIATARMAMSGDEKWREEMEAIRKRHQNIIDTLTPESQRREVEEKVSELLDSLEKNYEGVFLICQLPEKTLDLIVSYGERISSLIVASIIENGKRYFSPDFVKTEKWYGKNIAHRAATDELIKKAFSQLGELEKAIVPGFISTDHNTGEITNLGRGGSDYTGALIAAALNAEVLEIWTDVDGFMTADPRIVKDALLIDHLSFTESMELCTFGAKVVYPPTIYPVFHSNIPIKILNTFRPDGPGTLITDIHRPDDFEVKGVTVLKDVALITISYEEGYDNPEILKRALNTLSRQAVRIIPLANPKPETELKFAVLESDLKVSVEMLEKDFAPEIARNEINISTSQEELAAVAIVGKEMKAKTRLAARIGHSLERQGVKVEAHSTGNSDTTLIYIINQGKTLEALPLIHSLIF